MTVEMVYVSCKRLARSSPFCISWHGIRDSPMSLLTNGFVINHGWLFGPPEQSRWHRRSLWQAQSLIFSTNSWF
jgi:hypothetical protein